MVFETLLSEFLDSFLFRSGGYRGYEKQSSDCVDLICGIEKNCDVAEEVCWCVCSLIVGTFMEEVLFLGVWPKVCC